MTKVNLKIPSQPVMTVEQLDVGDYFSVANQENKIYIKSDISNLKDIAPSVTCINIASGKINKISPYCLVTKVYEEVSISLK